MTFNDAINIELLDRFLTNLKNLFARKTDVPAASTTTPNMDGTAAVGSSTTYARADHRHPTDSTRAPLASPSFTGTPTAPTAASGTNTTQIATTAFVKAVIAADNPVKGGDFIVNSLAANINNTKKGLYITDINDRLYAADNRFYVTHKVFEIEGDTFVKNLSTVVFSGNIERYGNTITEEQYAELYIGSEPEDTLGTDGSMIWTYGNEFIYLTFYVTRYPDAIYEAKAYYKYNNVGWVSCSITKISDCVYKINTPNNTYLSAIKIKWLGSSSRLVSLSDVKAFAGRSTLQSESLVSKYPIKQDLWGEVEAPKFIKRGGTSSQFLKADGSVDSNSYATTSSVPTKVSQLTNDTGFIVGDDVVFAGDDDGQGVIAEGGDVNVIETVKVNGTALTPDANKAVNVVVPTSLSGLASDTTHRTVTDTEKSTWNGKQDALVSGTNIKTINNESILGSGNITIQGSSGGSGDENIIESITFNGTAVPVDSNKNAAITVTIPAAVTESTVSGWGFTKNTGTYSKPSGGIPASDLAAGVIPTVPTKVSDLTNDSGFITGYTETDPTVPAWAKAANKPSYTAAEVGALPDTTTIPAAPGTLNTTATTAQSTSSSEALSGSVILHKVAKTGTYNDLIGKPTIPTVPTNVSAFTNDAGYLTSASVVTIYSGSTAPSSSLGNNGDIYIQTS